MKQNTAQETGLDDAMTLIEALELPYLKALQTRLAEHVVKREVAERGDALAEIRRIAARVGMSVDALLAGVKASPTHAKPAKYRHPDGRTWSGAGREPLWIKGQDRAPFLIP